MLVVCPRLLSAVTVLLMSLQLSSVWPAVEKRVMKSINLPYGCTVTDVESGKVLNCKRALVHEILATMRMLGEDLVEVNVKICNHLSVPVELNHSSFETNINLMSLNFIIIDNIDIHWCSIEKVAPGTFEKLSKLEKLSLPSNRISEITKETFRGLENLTVLDLSNNGIQDISNDTFGYFRKLDTVRFRVNKIRVINKETLRGLETLSTLNLLLNAIEEVPNGTFEYFTKLEKLSLASNKISVINKEMFRGLENLLKLDLAYNEIGHIPSGTFGYLGNLLKLDLTGNHVFVISLIDLKNLEVLNLGGQRRKSGHGFNPSNDTFRGLTHLRKLDLKGAYFSIWRYLQHSEKLDPSLFFKDQEDSLTHLHMVDTYLTNNDLLWLKNLKRIQTLDLSDNKLGYILNGLNRSLPKLARNGSLDLSSNKILYIEGEALSDFVGNIDVSDNAFYCDCKLLGFSYWLWKYNKSRDSEPSALCGGPVSMYGTKVLDYNPYWWQCSMYIPLIALVAGIGFLSLLALIILVVSCNRVNFKHWLLERRAAAIAEQEGQQQAEATERSALLSPNRLCGISSLPKGRTDAYILYNMNEDDVKRWVDHHIEEKLYNHPMKIKLQWAAGPDYIPLWKQVKDYGLGVKHFLVVVTDDLLKNHWPLMSKNVGVENLSKFVLVLWGKKKNDLPKELLILRCPCIEWPLTKPKMSSWQREREHFWKRVRLAVKDLSN